MVIGGARAWAYRLDVLCTKQEPCPRSHLHVLRRGAQFAIGLGKGASSPRIKICVRARASAARRRTPRRTADGAAAVLLLVVERKREMLGPSHRERHAPPFLTLVAVFSFFRSTLAGVRQSSIFFYMLLVCSSCARLPVCSPARLLVCSSARLLVSEKQYMMVVLNF